MATRASPLCIGVCAMASLEQAFLDNPPWWPCSSCSRSYLFSLWAECCSVCRLEDFSFPGFRLTLLHVFETEEEGWKELSKMENCSIVNCEGLAPAYLDGLCENCFRSSIGQRMKARKFHLARSVELEREINQMIDRLDGPKTEGRPSILHRCICGKASISW